MTTYSVSWYRGKQIDGDSDTTTESALSAGSAYWKAVEAQTTPGCRLLRVSRESDHFRVTVRQLRAWSRIAKAKGSQ